jgi:glycosyltransferase involved in cell wall biosynthesis
MSKIYDYVFVTHLPAFYKINLYNKLAEQLSILVIFISGSSVIRTPDFVQTINYHFDYRVINQEPFEERNKLYSSIKFIKILHQIQYKKIILGGWDLIEFWVAWGFCPKEKLALALESSIHESQTTGPKSWLKKCFVSKLSTAYVSGLFQKELIEKLDFKKTHIITGGVGLISPPKKSEKIIVGAQNFRARFLYLGRLAQEKNIDLLVDIFAQKCRDYDLSIVGNGPLDNFIQKKIKDIKNIRLYKHVPNSEIHALFEAHDVLILPSQQEPWGLVVEEAMAYGLPVIVSDKVGCHPELIKHQINGYVFSLADKHLGLTEACHWVVENHDKLVKNIVENPELDWRWREQQQLAAYLK